MLKREVWNNVFTPPWRGLRLLLFALAIMLIASSIGELKKTQGQSSSTCNLSYRETTFWPTGFQGEITIRNSGPAINGWTVAFTFPATTQTIYELWNGVYTQSGQSVTVSNAPYNANIPTGGSIVFGFNANWSGSHPAPTGLTLNGQPCGVSGPTIQTSVTTLNVNEGGSAEFGVRLSSAPAGNVTVNVARLSGDTDLSVTGGATLTFTPTNFGTFQNVTISAAEDADSTNGSAVIRVSSTGLPNVDVTANEVDNDPPPMVAIQTSVSTLSVNEGGSAQFGVRLSAAPSGGTATVNVARLSGDTDLTGMATLTFTSANFGTFQNVTISAAEDAGTANGTAVCRASGITLLGADANSNEVDNDPPPMVAIQTSVTTLSVNEGGSAQFGVRLSAAPSSGTATVNVARLSGDTDLTGMATLTFTSANFGTFQNVMISAAEDADTANGTAVFRASGTGLQSADVNVSEADNDPPVIAIQTNLTRSPLVAIENSSAQLGLRLASAPPGNVTVTVTRLSGDADLRVNLPGTVTFTPTNFATFQSVTISAAEDADITNGTAIFRASGTNLTSVDVNVSEFDNDGAPVAQRTFVAILNGANEVPPVTTSASGTSTVILSSDETSALVSLNFSGLTSPQTAAHLHAPAAPGNNAGVVLDLDQPLGQISNLLWVFQPAGGLTVQGLIDALRGGQMYANVHSANFPSGEIRG